MTALPAAVGSDCAALVIREGRDDDGAAMARLIGAVFAEYPGCVLDVEGECPDLLAPARYYRVRDGYFWVAENDGLVATVCCDPDPDGRAMELKRLYVAAGARNRGIAARLCGLVEAKARDRGFERVTLWTDTRFVDAHRFYLRRGYIRQNATRALHDLSDSIEYQFIKTLG